MGAALLRTTAVRYHGGSNCRKHPTPRTDEAGIIKTWMFGKERPHASEDRISALGL